MPRPLREKMVPWWVGALVAAVASLVAFLRGAMLDLNTQLMGMTLAWYGLHVLRNVLARMRRYSGHWFVQYGAMAGCYLHFPLAVYAANTVRYSSDSTQDHVALCSLLHLGSCYGPMHNAYTLGEGPFKGWRFLNAVYIYFSVWSSLYIKQEAEEGNDWSSHYLLHTSMHILWCVVLVFIPYVWSNVTLEPRARAFADWMKKKANSVPPFFDGDASNGLHGCKYPIMLNRGSHMIMSVNDVRTHINIDGAVPDIFLSYSFSQLLARRYFGFHCAEEGNAMVRDFALQELMQPPNYERAFAIVEAQLGFLHDAYFITIYSSTTARSSLDVLSIPTTYLFAVSTAGVADRIAAILCLHWFAAVLIPIIIASAILGLEMEWFEATDLFIILDALNRGTFITPSRSNVFRRPYWKKEIGQYSLIQDYDSCSAKKKSLFFLKGVILSDWPPTFIKHHPVEEAAAALPDSVRKLVARTLRAINGPPTNGIRSLQRNRDRIMQNITDDLSWTCKQDTHTHTILIWHIATCYMVPPDSYRPKKLCLVEIDTCYEVASALSGYCAYLVAFLPEFLPANKVPTQLVFQDVLQEAKRLLGSTGLSLDKKRTKMWGLELQGALDNLSTFQKGVKLGQQLQKLDTLLRWKVTAEFWAETILYVAPSDKAALHVQHLAQGGEFVTHLWAMLSNAGILRRATEEEMYPQQPGPEPEPAAPAIEEEAARLEAMLSSILQQAREEEEEIVLEQPDGASTSESKEEVLVRLKSRLEAMASRIQDHQERAREEQMNPQQPELAASASE